MPRTVICKRLALVSFMALAACSGDQIVCLPAPHADIVYIVEHQWHAEIGIPVEELQGGLTFFRELYPAARTIMFGYGKKTFFTAPPESISEYVLGPFPGTAVVQTVALSVTPLEAYGPSTDTVVLGLPSEGAQRLSSFIWDDLIKNDDGNLEAVAHSSSPAGVFYAARSEYNLLHTCNTWTASALHSAGLPISDDLIAFSGQVMDRVNGAAHQQCLN